VTSLPSSGTSTSSVVSLSPTRAKLEALREIQRWGDTFIPIEPSPGSTAPDLCLAAAKFTAGKIVGLFPAASHLDDFLKSLEAKKAATKLKADQSKGVAKPGGVTRAWGGDLTMVKEFNKDVLPEAIAWGHLHSGTVAFGEFWGNAAYADQLLAQQVPLVVGISLHGGATRDHFICIVMDSSKQVWAIDSWGNWTTGSVVPLPAGVSFKSPVTASLNAGTAVIPCTPAFFGLYSSTSPLHAVGI
jgi:hypothetical protein